MAESRVDTRCEVKTWTWWIAVLLALLAAHGLPAQQQDHREDNDDSMGGGKGNWPELMSSINQMHAVMHSVEPSGNSDTDFVRLMLPHHQGAIDMAKTELMRGKDPEIRRLAQEIITDQQSEIMLMQLWYKQHEPQK